MFFHGQSRAAFDAPSRTSCSEEEKIDIKNIQYSKKVYKLTKEEIDKALGFKIFDIVSGTVDGYIYSDVNANDLINKTHITQPAILLASYLEYRSITQKLNIKPDLVCGHSLGEYSALAASGSLNFKDTIKLLKTRIENYMKLLV